MLILMTMEEAHLKETKKQSAFWYKKVIETDGEILFNDMETHA